jgi:hypothetical protein
LYWLLGLGVVREHAFGGHRFLLSGVQKSVDLFLEGALLHRPLFGPSVTELVVEV